MRDSPKPHTDDAVRSQAVAGRGVGEQNAAQEGLDLAQLWAAIRRSPGVVFGTAAIVFVLVMAATFNSRMLFRSTGQLYLGELEQRGRNRDIELSGGSAGDVSSEVEILRSRTAVYKAAFEAGLNVELTRAGERPPKFWKWLLQHRDRHLLDVTADEVTATHTALVDEGTAGGAFRLKFLSDVQYEVWEADERLGRGELEKPFKSPSVLLTLHAGAEKSPEPGAVYDLRVSALTPVVDGARAGLTVVPAKGTGAEPAKVITIEFAHTSPLGASNFLRHLMQTYLDERQAWKAADASAAENFVTDRLEMMRDSLDTTEKRLSDYRSTTPGVVMENEAEAMVNQIGHFEEQRVAARLQVAALWKLRQALKYPEGNIESALVGELDDKVLAEFASTLSKARQELTSAEVRYGRTSLEAMKIREHVETQLSMVRNYVTTRMGRAQDNLSKLNDVITQYETKLQAVPGAEFGLSRLARDSDVFRRIYSYLLEQQQQMAITKASTVSRNRVLDLPEPTYAEDTPKLALRLSSGLLGVLLGALVVVVRYLLASTFQSEADVRRTLAAFPILAAIPGPRKRNRPQEPRADAPSSDAIALDPRSGYAEAFRLLRSNLYKQESSENAGRVVLLTSPAADDGKTNTCLSLAAMLAADKRSVVVVDADVRKPSHHILMRIDAAPGLSEILQGREAWQHVVQSVAIPHGELFAITAGQDATAEHLNGERLAPLFSQLRTRYDVVLVDCGSFPSVSDALVLGSFADSIISVVRLKNTPRQTAAEHARILSGLNSHYGVVINDVEPELETTDLRPLQRSLRTIWSMIAKADK
jgi:tyrosine-protein kinase Etk/Wzc